GRTVIVRHDLKVVPYFLKEILDSGPVKDYLFAPRRTSRLGGGMRTRIGLAILAAGALGVALVGIFVPVPSQAQAVALPRAADGNPDLAGIWHAMHSSN